VPTLEYENGVAVRKKDSFRAYDSPSESFNDYADMLASSPRYAAAVGRGDDVKGFAKALVNGGYATDPSYAQKLTDIANGPVMKQALAALEQVASQL
jgi:flagellar protein FlgJ